MKKEDRVPLVFKMGGYTYEELRARDKLISFSFTYAAGSTTWQPVPKLETRTAWHVLTVEISRFMKLEPGTIARLIARENQLPTGAWVRLVRREDISIGVNSITKIPAWIVEPTEDDGRGPIAISQYNLEALAPPEK